MAELTPIVRGLIELGGWGALLVVGVAIVIGGARRVWVWGWQHESEAKARTAAEQRLDLLTDAVRDLTDEIRWGDRRRSDRNPDA